MGFSELLEEAGGFGRYQWLHVTLISIPGLLMAGQNLLNNFVSGVPDHHCRPPANYSLFNLSQLHQVDEKEMLRVFIPIDSTGSRLDRCRRYVTPQWQLLATNSSSNVSHVQTEGCVDGWTFDRSEFSETTVSEVSKERPHDFKEGTIKVNVRPRHQPSFLIGHFKRPCFLVEGKEGAIKSEQVKSLADSQKNP